MFWSIEGAHEVLDLFEVHSVEVVVVAGFPALLVAVDVVNDRLEFQEEAYLLGDYREGEQAPSLQSLPITITYLMYFLSSFRINRSG